jgi:hypothetical protein
MSGAGKGKDAAAAEMDDGDELDENALAEMEKELERSEQEMDQYDQSDMPEGGMVIHPSGGMHCVDRRLLHLQRTVVWRMAKQLGYSLAKGNMGAARDVMRMSLPVDLFEPRSVLQRLTDDWVYGPKYLTAAARSKDPLERFRNAVCFAFAGVRSGSIGQWKPFNPILGETYQSQFKDGTQCFLEQTSHHPPVSHFEVTSPLGWKIHGWRLYEVALQGNSITGKRLGPNVIEFEDGCKITFTMPPMLVTGMAWGERVMHIVGTMVFRDEKNDLSLELEFTPPPPKKTWGGTAVSLVKAPLRMLWGSKPAAQPADGTTSGLVQGVIRRGDTELQKVSGNWVDTLCFDGDKVWDFAEQGAELSVEVADPLPSDARFRTDLQALAQGDLEESQSLKVKLEEAQRADASLRKAAGWGENAH